VDDPIASITVKEMRALVLLSKGHNQTKAAGMLDTCQPGIAQKIKKLERLYGIQALTGPKGCRMVSIDGMNLASQFEEALHILEGTSQESEVRKKVAALKVALKDFSEIAYSI